MKVDSRGTPPGRSIPGAQEPSGLGVFPGRAGTMDGTKSYKSIGFGAMDGTKPYEFTGFGAMDGTKPNIFIGFGAMDGTNPMNL